MHTKVAAMFSVLYCAAVCAVEISSDTTVSVTADSAEDYEIAEGATLSFSVATDASFTLSGVISGAGAVRKNGAGELILSNPANSFSGGLYLNQGAIRATDSHAFGTGGITNNGPSFLIFDAKDGVFPNSIWQTGSVASQSDPALAAIQFRQDTVLEGGITAISAHLMIANSRTSSANPNVAKGPRSVVKGSIKVASGMNFRVNSYGTNSFHGAIDDSGDGAYAYFGQNWSSSGTLEFGSPENKWKNGVQIYSSTISCLADNVISNAVVYWSYSTLGTNPYGDYMSTVKLNGHSQRIRSLRGGGTSVATGTSNGYMIESTEPATLTILGESTSRQCDCRIKDEITVVLDAAAYPNFVQTISNRTCTTKGDLVVSNGTLRLKNMAAFPNVPNLVIGAGGTLDMQSVAALPLGSVTNCIIDGKLLAPFATCAGFTREQVEMSLGSSAELHLADSDTLILKSLTVNGQKVESDSYTAADGRIPQLKSGGLVVMPEGDVASSASWTGLGETDAINVAGNWSDPKATVIVGSMDATFATGGDHATVTGQTRFRNLSFAPAPGTTGFTFDAVGDAARLESYGDFATFAGPATYTFNVPVKLSTRQEWTFSGNAVARFSTNFVSATGLVYMKGSGQVAFNGATEFTGGLFITNGMVVSINGAKLTAADGVALSAPTYGGGTTLSLRGDKSTKLVLSNATVRMPVYMQAVIGTHPVVAAPASTNVFVGAVYQGSAWSGFNVPAGSEIILRGGLTSTAASPRFVYPGTVRIQDTPVSATKSIGWNQQNGRLVFETTGSTFSYLTTGYQPEVSDAPVIEFKVSGALKDGCLVNAPTFVNNSRFAPSTKSGFKALVEFNATTQRVDSLVGFPLGTFNGEKGSLLEVLKQTGGSYIDATNRYVASDFTGALSLKMSGTGDLVLTNRAFSSYGDLEVVSGTLSIAHDATWQNGSNVTVRGTGTLRLGDGARFGKHVALHLGADGDAWKIAMPNGGLQRVYCIYDADGKLLPSGIYGASGAPGVNRTRYASHFTGTGVISAANLGMQFILR